MLHSAQASEQSLALAQEIVLAREVIEEKSSEITAIPEVLDTLQSDGTLVTIGAMGREIDIAEEILEEKAEPMLRVWGLRSQGQVPTPKRRVGRTPRQRRISQGVCLLGGLRA